MADLDASKSSMLTTPKQSPPSSPSSSWLSTLNLNLFHRAIFFSILVALLPLFPSQPPEPLNTSFFSRGWELLRLLLVGIAISYGLFSRRNTDSDTEDKDLHAVPPPKSDVSPHSYVARILHVSSVFDDDDNYADAAVAATASPEPSLDDQTRTTQAWSSQYYPGEPAVMVADDVSEKPLSLPVRRLRASFDEENKDSVVLPSPIPWRSRSGRMMEVNEQLLHGNATSSTAASPPSPELRSKSGEDTIKTKKTMQKSATLPPPPPPPPPPSYIHGYSAYTDRRDYKNRSFTEELKDHSRSRVREEIMQPKSVRTLRGKEMNGYLERAAKVASETSPERMAVENRQPSPPTQLLRSQSERAIDGTRKRRTNGFREKVSIVYSNHDTENDLHADQEETTEVAEGSPRGITGEEAPPSPPPPPPPPGDDNEVDKKADEFIAKFREQIRLQRIESIKKSTGQRSPRSPK